MPDYPLLRRRPRHQLSATSVAGVISERLAHGEPTLSFEFFPPKDAATEASLWQTLDDVIEAGADFASLTYGAGGSNQAKSLEIIDRMAPRITTIGHLTAVGASREASIAVIRAFESAGVASILALRGDPPNQNPDALEQGEFKTALELVSLVHEVSNLEIGVAAFPEGHPESPSLHHDAQVLKLKEDAGATFAITQLFFGVKPYLDLVSTSRDVGVTIPIIPGVMPINNAKQVMRMAAMSGAAVPTELVEALEAAADEAESRALGMSYMIQLGRELLEVGAPGLHIFTLNQSKSALELASAVGLVTR